jgi:hypothetical protein
MNNLNLNVETPAILKSKRFWTMLIEAIFMIVVSLIPELEENAPQLIEASVLVAGLVIGGYSLEDAAAAFKTGASNDKYQ